MEHFCFDNVLSVKEIMYKPLPDNVTIKESPIHGFGLYATEVISQGTLIGTTHHVNEHSENGVIRTPLGGFGNHSDTPNCFKLMMEETTWMIGASKDIEPGEELTWAYTFYDLNKKEIMTLDLKEERHLDMTIKVLKEQVEIFTSRLEPHDTGHLHTTISVLTHRIEELKNGRG